MRQDTVILHLDMDAFFASCEQAHNPSLKATPVVVSRYDEHSIITAASYECRAYGVKAGMPIFQAKKLLAGVEFKIVNSGYELYEKYSAMVFACLKAQFTTKIEIIGLDECYLDVTEIYPQYGSVKNLCLAIQAHVYQTTHLTCSIGASFNKLFAKMASDLNKPNGFMIITRYNFKALIWQLPITSVIGIGAIFAEQCVAHKIYKVLDFINLAPQLVLRYFGNYGIKLHQALKGHSNARVDYLSTQIKSISKEKTLTLKQRLTVHDEELHQLLFSLTTNVVYRLKQLDCKAKNIQLAIKFFSQYPTDKKRKTYSHRLAQYTDDFEIIYSWLAAKLDEINRNDYVNLLGAGISNIIESKKVVTQSTIELPTSF